MLVFTLIWIDENIVYTNFSSTPIAATSTLLILKDGQL